MRNGLTAVALLALFGGCQTTDSAKRAYTKVGTSTVTEEFEEVVTTSDDGKTQTTKSRRVTSSYSSPALGAMKAIGGMAGKAAP